MKIYRILLLGMIVIVLACTNIKNNQFLELIETWMGKQIFYPHNESCACVGGSSLYNPIASYKMLVYIDSTGCMSCKLDWHKWKNTIQELDSIPTLFYLHYFDVEKMKHLLKRDNFLYPVCIDTGDAFNKLNKLPKDESFHTFLLDMDDKVVAIGDPTRNYKVKELYLNIIKGRKANSWNEVSYTTAVLSDTLIELPTFDWQQEQVKEVLLTNTGKEVLKVKDITPSCKCITVECNGASVVSGEAIKLKIRYQAECPGVFYRTVEVYCNTKNSPLEIEIMGECK